MAAPLCSSSPVAASLRSSRRRARRWTALIILILVVVAVAGWAGGAAQILNYLAAQALLSRDTESAGKWLAILRNCRLVDASAELLEARVARHQQDYDAVRDHLARA